VFLIETTYTYIPGISAYRALCCNPEGLTVSLSTYLSVLAVLAAVLRFDGDEPSQLG